ncbi:hypothetical protein HG535_0C03530 [Zygotorulaspora mrakii]|uniref:Exosome complex protein n=1 Tax=Zygotorulaspora mrakii TaxID=42260 RepID=A0A7H9B047_ZYGMR|nr:uncharacterized protein HG535_0C03530 [Zygotorulaspora mrakii]QLG72000.1 hypothetical protein HG535_0C03530 [Zygotorulaspora mrakii]
MDEVEKIRPYIAHLNKQLRLLKPDLEKMTSKSLDEQLLLLSDERSKLDLTNKYSYVLSSLMFAYMKVLNVKDVSPIMAELTRVKTYMNKAKSFDEKQDRKKGLEQSEQKKARRVINSVLDGNHASPAISKVHFQGKHTRFDNKSSGKDDPETISAEEITEKIKEAKSKKPNSTEKRKSKSKQKSIKVHKRK